MRLFSGFWRGLIFVEYTTPPPHTHLTNPHKRNRTHALMDLVGIMSLIFPCVLAGS